MDDKTIPMYNPDDTSHKYIWDSLGFKLTDEDFKAIQKIIVERADEHEAIDKSQVIPVEFSKGKMYQPRPLPDHMKLGMHKYVDWSASTDIWLILSKYADFYSKKKF